ncbi:STAS domain-containing protein [Streptacidiphilus sp. N1-3]|uniref:Anti-sigma factor antagonist n=1 Tax=Streptacidiphilus alkalitolerans TaxID=3342712 RepID=A0ABV6XAX8_9ACTN
MTEPLAFTVQQHAGPRAVVQVSGDMDMETCPPLERALTRLIDDSTPHLALDMSGVGFLDSPGINALLRTANRAREHHGSLALAALPPHLRRVLEIVGVDAVIPLHHSVADALPSAGGDTATGSTEPANH